MRRPVQTSGRVHGTARPRLRRVALLALLVALPGAAAASPEGGARGGRFALDAPSLADSTVARAAGESAAAARARLWGRAEAEALASRVRDLLAVEGRFEAVVRLALRPGPGTAPGTATLSIVDEDGDGGGVASRGDRGTGEAAAPRTARPLRAVMRDAEGGDVDPGLLRAFDRAARGRRGTPEGAAGRIWEIGAGLDAIRDALLERGFYAADVAVDSVVPGAAETVVHLTVRSGGAVTLESFSLEGARTTRPGAASAIAGLRPGDRLRPSRLAAARDRLQGSDLFVFVGAPRVAPGNAPDRARVVVPVEEARGSRFEGVVGAAREGGVTGALDLALANIAGTGRGAGLRWAGLGAAGTEYEARYREPALFGRPIDASAQLDAHVVDSLFTRTRWSAALGIRAGLRGRASLAFARTATTYGGVARGTNGTWTASLGFGWRALTPAANPRAGFAVAMTGEGGERREETPGLPVWHRRLRRGAFLGEAALPRGAGAAWYAATRFEVVSLDGATFPVEELRYVGGSEGLRGHRDRAFAGNRIAAFSVEHRWLSDPAGGRAYLFADAARHDLDRAPSAGSAAPGSAAAALARTEWRPGWEFGYGAGLQARVAAGLVGVELGLRPGASLGAATLHLRYGSRW